MRTIYINQCTSTYCASASFPTHPKLLQQVGTKKVYAYPKYIAFPVKYIYQKAFSAVQGELKGLDTVSMTPNKKNCILNIITDALTA